MDAENRSRRDALEAYFEALDEGEFGRAARQFTRDTVYVHPPMYSDEARIEGRDDLLEYFTETRGENELVHHLDRVSVTETTCSAVGYVTRGDEDDPIEYFVAFAEFDGDQIAYYIAGLLGIGEVDA